MKLKADLFPYPVLSKDLDDYTGSEFSSNLNLKQIAPSKINLNVKFNLDDNILKDLIAANKAYYAVHLEGVGSSYRQLYLTDNLQTELEIRLNADEISGKVEVNTMVLANEHIESYKNPNFNQDFYGENFEIMNINKGDILAFDTMAEIDIKFKNKEKPNAKSMIRVAAINDIYMDVNIDGDVILVNLPKRAHEAYQILSRSSNIKQDMLLVTVVLPALMFVIERVKNNDYNHESLWVSALLELLGKIGYDEETLKTADAMKVAQQLLDAPVEKALYEFYQGAEDNDDE